MDEVVSEGDGEVGVGASAAAWRGMGVGVGGGTGVGVVSGCGPVLIELEVLDAGMVVDASRTWGVEDAERLAAVVEAVESGVDEAETSAAATASMVGEETTGRALAG